MENESYLERRFEAGRLYESTGILELIKKLTEMPFHPPKFVDPILDGLTDVLLTKPLAEQLDGYVWFLRKKYQAEEEDDYERAIRLRNSQERLEDVLYPHKNSELYISLEEFLETDKGIPKEQFARMYEKAILDFLDLNKFPAKMLAQPYVQIAIIVSIVKRHGYAEEYTKYFSGRNLETAIKHRHGMRSKIVPENQ
jgi:hypothetical protein